MHHILTIIRNLLKLAVATTVLRYTRPIRSWSEESGCTYFLLQVPAIHQVSKKIKYILQQCMVHIILNGCDLKQSFTLLQKITYLPQELLIALVTFIRLLPLSLKPMCFLMFPHSNSRKHPSTFITQHSHMSSLQMLHQPPGKEQFLTIRTTYQYFGHALYCLLLCFFPIWG